MSEEHLSFHDLIAALDLATVPVEEAEPASSSLDELQALFRDAGLSTQGPSAGVADALTRESQAFGAIRPENDPTAERDAIESVPQSDEFAARLTAAFYSGALDHRARSPVMTPAPTPRVADQANRPDEASRSFPRRSLFSAGQDMRRQKHIVPVGLTGRSLYSPW